MELTQLLAAFKTCTDQITLYYRALGYPLRCHFVNSMWYPESPGLGIDFVPEIAREGIERMAAAAGITVSRSDGGKGERGYFLFLAEGLTLEKLNDLTERVKAEAERVTARPATPGAAPGEARTAET